MSDQGLDPPSGWTQSEISLWEAFRKGDRLVLGEADPVTSQLPSDYWSPDTTIRASVLAHILLHGPEQEPGFPPRLILSGARITGKLDLGCGTTSPFHLNKCILENAPLFNDTTAEFVGFTSCVLPGLEAKRLRCNGPLWATDCRITGPIELEDCVISGDASFTRSSFDTPAAPVAVDLRGADIRSDLVLVRVTGNKSLRLHNATIGGDVTLQGARIFSIDGSAISGSQLKVGGSIIGFPDFECSGIVDFEGARVEGQLAFIEAQLRNPSRVCLDLDHAVVKLGVKCGGAKFEGTVRMHHGRFGCQVSFTNTHIMNCSNRALTADHLVVEGAGIFRSLQAEGKVHLHGAQFECNLDLDKIKVTTTTGAGLTLDGVSIGAAASIEDAEIHGLVDLEGATIGGALWLRRTKISPHGPVALNASRAVIRGGVEASTGFESRGMVSFSNANVDVAINLSDARLANPRQRCLQAAGLSLNGNLVADRIEVEGLVDLPEAVIKGDVRFADAHLLGVPLEESSRGREVDQVSGGDWRGASLRTRAAKVSGDIDFRGAQFAHTVVLDAAVVDQDVLFDGCRLNAEDSLALLARSFSARTLSIRFKTIPLNGISLAGAEVGTLRDSHLSWPTASPVDLEGFRYRTLDTGLTTTDRLRLLKRATPKYSPHPYEQLSQLMQSVGQGDEASKVQLASLRRSYESSRLPIKVWGKIQDIIVGYGYAPIRALAFFLLLLVGGGVWFTLVPEHCGRPGLGQLPLCPVNGEHPTWDPWLYSLDLLIPFVNLGHENAWDPTGTSKLIMYILIAGGWVLTTTIVAATGRHLRGRSY
jgi:hypothetical protein